MEGIFRGGSGQLENTVFALLSPDASQLLAPSGRDPGRLYSDASTMAASLNSLAQGYPGHQARQNELPLMADFRLGLNVAACDGLPLVVVTSAAAETRLAPAAWSAQNLGRAVYVKEALQDYPDGAYLMVPDTFGLSVTRMIPLAADITAAQLSQQLAPWKEPPKDDRTHIQQGRAQGIRWETKIPVTDPAGRY